MSGNFSRYDTGTAARDDIFPGWRDRELTADNTQAAESRAGIDLPFLILTLLILMIGVVMVLSASFARAYYTSGKPLYYFLRQLIFAGSGIALMLFASRINVKTMRRWSFMLLVVSVILLAAVLVIGKKVNGARRWIDLGFTDFQPSEIAKLAVILTYSSMICTIGKKMKTVKYGVLPFLIVTGVVSGLLIFEPHLSAIIIIVALSAILMFAGGTSLRWFVIAGVAVVLLASAVIFMTRSSQEEQAVSETQVAEESEESQGSKFGYANKRISAWLNPEADPSDSGFQILQSLYAVGSGGLFGQGLGQGRQKYLYLPEEHNDYIFAIVCEELGFIGAMLILVLFALLIIRGYWLALHARDRFSSLIVTGITSLLAIQVFLNVAVVTNLLPSTGISLPFFSYGGTALWIQMVEMGIILSVSRDIPLTKAG